MVEENETIAIILLLFITLITLFGIALCIRQWLFGRYQSPPDSEKTLSPLSSPSTTEGSNIHSPPRIMRMLTDAQGEAVRGETGRREAQMGNRDEELLLGSIRTDGGFNVADNSQIVSIQDSGFNAVLDGGFNVARSASNR